MNAAMLLQQNCNKLEKGVKQPYIFFFAYSQVKGDYPPGLTVIITPSLASATTQFNNFHITNHAHRPRGPCLFYKISESERIEEIMSEQ